MSFIHVHILQHPKAIHVHVYKSVEEPVKAKKCTISSIYLLFANIKGTLINSWVESYGSDLSRNAGTQTRMALGSLQKCTILIDLFV